VSESRMPVALITGASGGVGRGIAAALGASGWTVWVAARRPVEGQQVAEEVTKAGGQGRFIACDVNDAVSIESVIAAVVARDGRLDGVVHNATSALSPVPVVPTEVTMADLRDHVMVSLRAAYLLALASHPHLVKAKGSLVLLTSEAGFEGKMRLSPYAAVKAAVRGLARAWAREWGPEGVRVNCVAPLANSPAMEVALVKDPTMAARMFGHLPLGYLGDPSDDIGPVVRFLLSDDARYVTGATIMADGGSCPIS
jgi:NAD(P)-dependent dehydrogenase (short-subunit alcohol dehydrogenase family)